MNRKLILLAALLVTPLAELMADESRHPDVMTLPADSKNPVIADGAPAPGKMVLQTLPSYAGTEVSHTLYLPPEWEKGKSYPVIIEYLGNKNRVRDNGGKGFIWVNHGVTVLHRDTPERRQLREWLQQFLRNPPAK